MSMVYLPLKGWVLVGVALPLIGLLAKFDRDARKSVHWQKTEETP